MAQDGSGIGFSAEPTSTGTAFRTAGLFGVATGVIPVAGMKLPASAKDGLRGGGGGILSGPVEASLAKPRSSSLAMWRSRERGVLPPNTTAIRRRPLRLTEAARLKPEARM